MAPLELLLVTLRSGNLQQNLRMQRILEILTSKTP